MRRISNILMLVVIGYLVACSNVTGNPENGVDNPDDSAIPLDPQSQLLKIWEGDYQGIGSYSYESPTVRDTLPFGTSVFVSITQEYSVARFEGGDSVIVYRRNNVSGDTTRLSIQGHLSISFSNHCQFTKVGNEITGNFYNDYDHAAEGVRFTHRHALVKVQKIK